ncbi:MAG: hypothetical protein KVP17_000285 [Porospora cf. gigantea B]|nr:MAG: hypothetical protein KVP17_000285 [Porospora cf. gigantea B]
MLHTHRADGDVVSVLMRLMGSLDEKDGKKYLFGKGLSEEDVLSSLRRHRKNSQVQQSCGAFLAQQFKNISSAKHDHTINEIYASGRFNVPDPHASSQALDNFGAIVTNNKKCPGSIKNQRIMEKVTRAMEMQTRNSNTDGLIGKLIPLLTISLQ